MTVAELIALLQTMPQELPVTVPSNNTWRNPRLLYADDVLIDEEEHFDPANDADDYDAAVRHGPHVRIG